MRTVTREDKVAEFHKAMGLSVGAPFLLAEIELRERLLMEEFQELMDEFTQLKMDITRHGEPKSETVADMLKEMADLQYVLSGLAVNFDLPLLQAFNRVHESNMSKLDDRGYPIKDAQGKVQKGPNYQAPYLVDLIV